MLVDAGNIRRWCCVTPRVLIDCSLTKITSTQFWCPYGKSSDTLDCFHSWYETGILDTDLFSGDDSLKPGTRMPLLSIGTAVNFLAEDHHQPLSSIEIYCLVTARILRWRNGDVGCRGLIDQSDTTSWHLFYSGGWNNCKPVESLLHYHKIGCFCGTGVSSS